MECFCWQPFGKNIVLLILGFKPMDHDPFKYPLKKLYLKETWSFLGFLLGDIEKPIAPLLP